MPGGRPSKFTPALAHTLCVHVSYGARLETAAKAEGLSRDTLRRWMARYPEFHDQIMQAQGMCVVRLLNYLNRAAAQGDWRAAAWLLEHTQDYGPPPRRVGLDVEMGIPDFSRMSDADLEAYVVKLGGPAALGLTTPGCGCNGKSGPGDQGATGARAP